MTTAVSEFTRARLRFVASPTSGIESDALLVKRPSQTDLWKQRIDDLLDVRRMEDDWDGLGAPAPSVALVDSALQLVQIMKDNCFQAPCRVVAGLTGTVLFEWQSQGGAYLELEVTRPQQAEWTCMIPGKQTETGSIKW
jgi:hypothetical protein